MASRGKLRGLSLPVAGTKRVGAPVPSERPKKRQPSTSSHVNEVPDTTAVGASLPSPGSVRSNASLQPEPQPVSPSLPSPYQTNGWDHSRYPRIPHAQTHLETQHRDSNASIAFVNFPDPTMAHNATQSSLPSPSAQQPPTQYTDHQRLPSMNYSDQPTAKALYAQAPPTTSMQIPQPAQYYPSYPHFKSPFEPSFPSHRSFSGYPRPDESFVRGETYDQPSQQIYQSPVDPLTQPPPVPIKHEDEEVVEEIPPNSVDTECAILDDASAYSAPLSLDFGNLPLTPSFSSALGIGKTPRIQFLINYYAEVISPVIVAFDGPNNPYRTQILRIATESETLQHAISALAASNLRQRRETGVISTGKTDPARRSSMAHLTLTDEEWHNGGLLSPLDQAREETFHKNYAVKSLNRQLADPVARKNDSILAILLMLCLFHICDSGVAKFRTQFAGVKKLLSLRGNDLRLNTPETKWFTRMFTWFDAMTASVNDREGQLQGAHLDVSALSDEEWSLENLAGCDGELFKTIAKLGRLNVLSQGKTVESSPTLVSKPLPPMPFTNSDYSAFDGNGWMRMVADEDIFNSRTAEPDVQEQFWREWREIRQALQTWQLDPTLFSGENSSAPELTPDQRMDLANISESFRYAALLYTERLANPSAASTDGNIAAWVRQGLHFIKQVKSDVYLLWPLFIVGSECVQEADINVIRTRCLDIQKDSGFLNNKSTLDLLEKIWAANVLGQSNQGQTGFRFRKIMELEGNEGEYIVV